MLKRQILSFVAVGGVGFLIEAVVLTLLVAQGANVYMSRAVSFPMALTATWYLNRNHTFGGSRNKRFASAGKEYVAYLVVQVVGAVLNLMVFSLVLYYFKALATIPVIPLAIGALVALIFNFTCSKYLVYEKYGGIGGIHGN